MAQTKQARKIKMARLDVTISPIHDKKLKEEINTEASRGRIITKSDIIREELDRRYLLKETKESQV